MWRPNTKCEDHEQLLSKERPRVFLGNFFVKDSKKRSTPLVGYGAVILSASSNKKLNSLLAYFW
jgi:hypothetical protein